MVAETDLVVGNENIGTTMLEYDTWQSGDYIRVVRNQVLFQLLLSGVVVEVGEMNFENRSHN